MSFLVFKSQVLSTLVKPHTDTKRLAKAIAISYHGLILRHFEILTGGGLYVNGNVNGLQDYLQGVFDNNLHHAKKRVNLFEQMAPGIYNYWKGAIINGPLGYVNINNTGVFKGPIIPEHNNNLLLVNILSGVIAVHLKTMTGIYTNTVNNYTLDWSSNLLITFI